MKLIIAGTRTLNTSADSLTAWMDGFELIPDEIVSGHSGLVDKLGEYWAAENRIPCKLFPADWKKHGKAAGPIRNLEMAKYADALLLIWDGESRGSRNMKDLAQGWSKPVYQVILP